MQKTRRFAASTDVSVEASKAEVERTLKRYGADAFGYVTEASRAMIQFKAHGRFVRFMLPLPNRNDSQFTHKWKNQHAVDHKLTSQEAEDRYEQACRQAWRALLLIVKAKLEAVEAKIVTFEDEFLPYTVLPNGETVSEWIQPQVKEAYKSGLMPKNLLALAAPKGETDSTDVVDAEFSRS